MTTRKASAVLLLDDDEVLCVERSPDQSFFPGHHAFAGGTWEDVDEADGEEATFQNCAVREVAEETSIDLETDDLKPAGRVMTPPFAPVRYDTRLYVADVPDDAEPTPGGDVVDLHRHDPGEAVAAWERFELPVPPPVLRYLEVVDEHGDDAPEILESDTRQERLRIPIRLHPGHRLVPLHVRTLPPFEYVNAYLVGDDPFVVVDPGSPEASEQEVLAEIVDENLSAGAECLGVIPTHPHGDHVGGLADVVHRFGLDVLAHEETMTGLDAPPDRLLSDGDELDLGVYEPTDEDWTLRVHHLPGHHPGHIALEDTRRGAWLVGDLAAGVGTVVISPPDGDMATYIDSLERLKRQELGVLFPAHGPPIVDPAGHIDELIDHRLEREAKILDAVRDGRQTIAEIVEGAYDDVDPARHGLAEHTARAHLLKLEADGKVDRTGKGWIPVKD